MDYRLTRNAEQQIDAVLLESARSHGLAAAARYGRLLVTAMSVLAEEPAAIGSVEIPRLDRIRAYPTRLLRERMEPEHRVGNPRHLILYRLAADGVVEILGLIHDRMVLSRAARKIVRTIDES